MVAQLSVLALEYFDSTIVDLSKRSPHRVGSETDLTELCGFVDSM